jgi:hypothetical protein
MAIREEDFENCLMSYLLLSRPQHQPSLERIAEHTRLCGDLEDKMRAGKDAG